MFQPLVCVMLRIAVFAFSNSLRIARGFANSPYVDAFQSTTVVSNPETVVSTD